MLQIHIIRGSFSLGRACGFEGRERERVIEG
jgi:hypothetical protein